MDAEHSGELSESTAMTTKGDLVAGSRGLVLHDVDGMWRFATMVAKSGLAPRSLRQPEQILVALQMGSELGMAPMQSLKSIAVINGTPSVWGDGAIALVHQSGKAEYVREWTEGEGDKLVAHCEVKRLDSLHPHKVTFSWQDAKRAGLAGKDTYKQYPARMLQMRARAFALRDQFADVLCGFSIAEEVQDYPPQAQPVLQSGEVAPADDLDAICDAAEAEFTPSGSANASVPPPSAEAEPDFTLKGEGEAW